jgi:hypothetical protein
MKKVYLSFPILVICLIQPAYASNLHLDFSQNSQTYNWNSRLEYIYNQDKNFYWEFLFNLNSLLIKQEIQDRWQEDGNLRVKFGYLLKSNLKAGILLQHKLSSLGSRKITSQDYLLTAETNLWQKLKISQNVGISSINRKSEVTKGGESGLNYALALGIGPFNWEKAEVFVDLDQNLIRLERIPSQERDLKVRLNRNLSDKDSLNLEYQEGWSKKSFFSSEGSQTSTQRKTERVLRLDTSRGLFSGFLLKFGYDYQLNSYRYVSEEDTLFNPLFLRDNSLSSSNYTLSLSKIFFSRASLEGFYKYMSGNEDYGLTERNQDMNSGELGGRFSAKISDSDSGFVSASKGVTSFYTAPGSFFNDRDVLTKIFSVDYLHIFSRSFSMKVKTGFKNFHQIYISSHKSANNNYNETYNLSPSLSWRISQKIRFYQEYQIQANYISYDFQKATESNQNKIFRRASSFSRLNYSASENLEGELSYLYRYEDFGQLLWKDEWVRRPSWERNTQGFGISVKHKLTKSVIFSSGYNYEIRKDYSLVLDLPTGKEEKIFTYKFYRNLLNFSLDYITSDVNFIKFLWTIRAQKETGSKEELSNYITISVGRTL